MGKSLLDREVKSLAGADKKAFVGGLADEVEAAAGSQDVRILYRITKVLSGKYSPCNQPDKDASGNIFPGEDGKKEKMKGTL